MTSPLPRALKNLVRKELQDIDPYRVPARRESVAKLDSNESPHGLPDHIATGLAEHLKTVELHRYPAGDCHGLRQIIAGQLGVPDDTLVFGNGSGELITFLISTFANPRPGGSRAAILYPTPSFAFYSAACRSGGVQAIEVPLDTEFQLDIAALDSALIQKPNMAFFARPNNPTGTVWSGDAILRWIRQYDDVLFVVDEAYIDYGGDSFVEHVASHPNLCVMRTLSKLGLAALRIGFLHANAGIIDELGKVRPPYNVGALNQAAAAWLLTHHGAFLADQCRAVASARNDLNRVLSSMDKVQVFDSEANLVFFRLGVPGDGYATEIWQKLADRGVLVRNFDHPDLAPGCLRVSVGTDAENQLFLTALQDVLR